MTETARILWIDDDKVFVESMAEVLRTRDFKVETATTGKQALAIVKSSDYDLLVTDLSMPGMDGIELIRQVRRLNPAQRIIVVTDFPSHESQEEAFKLGAFSYIIKPFAPDRFLELVAKAISGNGEERLVGSVELRCEDLIQIYTMEGKTITLEIYTGKEVGRIYFKKGKIVHAETDNNKGEDAFYEIQSWRGGVFKTEPYDKKVSRTIRASVDALLLKGAKLQDERLKDNNSKAKETQTTKEDIMPSPSQQVVDEAAKGLDGLLGCVVAGMDGIPIATIDRSGGKLPTDSLAAKFALMMSLSRKTLIELGSGDLEETLTESEKVWILTRFIGAGHYFLTVAVTRDAVLGNVRMVAKQTVERLAQVLG